MSYRKVEDEVIDAQAERLAELRRALDLALDTLWSVAHEFDGTSQVRWLAALKEANEARDRLWSAQRSEGPNG